MAMLLAELYRALRDAGASEDQASKAATEVAGFENRLNAVERDLAVLKWMVGTNVAMTLAVLWRVFSH